MLDGGLDSALVHSGVEAQLVHKDYGVASLGILEMRRSANHTGSVKHHGAAVLGQAQRYNHKK